MAKFKVRRLSRYEAFRRKGFTHEEAMVFSQPTYNIKTPYFKGVIANRNRDFVRSGLTHEQWDKKIRKQYVDKGWVKKTLSGKAVIDPWKMYRSYEDRYKDKAKTRGDKLEPSPSKVRYRKFSKGMDRIDTTIKQAKGRYNKDYKEFAP